MEVTMAKKWLYMRDFIFFILLIILLKIFVINGKNYRIIEEFGDCPRENKTTSLHISDKDDDKIAYYITVLHNQLRESQVILPDKHHSGIEDLIDQLEDIEHDYNYLSPGAAPLGPLATTAFILKQKEYQCKLIEISKKLAQLLVSQDSKVIQKNNQTNIHNILLHNKKVLTFLKMRKKHE